MAIYLDKTPITIVIVCTDCPWWRGLRFDMAEAHECATGHETLMHPDTLTARNAARVWKKRFRSAARNVPTAP